MNIRNLLVAALLAVSLPLAACAAPTAKDKASKVAAATAAIGSEVSDGKFSFVVTHVETAPVAGSSNPYLQSKAKGEFVIVHVKVSNTGDKAQSFFASNQKLIAAGGKTFEADAMASLTADEGEINPGLSTEASIAFDVPKGTVPEAIELHDSMFSGGQIVKL